VKNGVFTPLVFWTNGEMVDECKKSSDRPPYGGFYNELATSMTSLCSANNMADFIMRFQNL
jgi:hypothetical protein